jgi:hypothetical protein
VRGLLFRTTGSLANMPVKELPMPVPKAGEVLVQVFATAINPSDAKNVLGKILPFDHLAGMFVKTKFPLRVLSVAVVLIAFALPSPAEVLPPLRMSCCATKKITVICRIRTVATIFGTLSNTCL